MQFSLDKKIEYAILSPNRIMIGKNVMIEGPLGAGYGVDPATGLANPVELGTANGDPVTMRSDFYSLEGTLDTKLDSFFATVITNDVDGDGRLRPDHPTEGAGLASLPDLVDYDQDEYITDFDLFLAHYDSNGDRRVVYDADLAAELGLTLSVEFAAGVDDQLATLIDEANADRDDDGAETASDRLLGYRDGIIDIYDQYAKITGRLAFKVSESDWEAAHGGSYQTVVQGPIRTNIDVPAVTFQIPDEELLEITTDMFNTSRTWFENQVPIRGRRRRR